MHYNQFTEKYHLDEEMALDMSNAIVYFYASMEAFVLELKWFSKLYTEEFKVETDLSVLVDKILTKDDLGKHSITETQLTKIKESLAPLAEYFVLLKSGDLKDYEIELSQDEKMNAILIAKEIAALLLMFHGTFGLGVNPEHLDEYVIL